MYCSRVLAEGCVCVCVCVCVECVDGVCVCVCGVCGWCVCVWGVGGEGTWMVIHIHKCMTTEEVRHA